MWPNELIIDDDGIQNAISMDPATLTSSQTNTKTSMDITNDSTKDRTQTGNEQRNI